MVKSQDSIELRPQASKTYILTAIQQDVQKKEEIDITVFPTPTLDIIKVPMPNYEQIIRLDSIKVNYPIIKKAEAPRIDVSVTIPNFFHDITKKPFVDIGKIVDIYKSKKFVFNLSAIYGRIKQKLSKLKSKRRKNSKN
jgi:hypothetical protein